MTDDLLGPYRDAHYSFEPRGRAAINVRVDQPSLETDALFAQRNPPSISIITSYNPRSQILPDSENRRRNILLRRHLEAARRPAHKAKGQSADGHWSEASWAVEDLPEDELRRIAIFHGQNAVVRIEQGCPAELIPIFANLPIFVGSADDLIEMMRENAIGAPEPTDWRKLWELVVTMNDGKLELPSLKLPPVYREYRQAEQNNPDSLWHLFHLHLKAIEGSALHWDLACAAITHALRWRRSATTGRRSLFDLRDECDLELPMQTTRLTFGLYGNFQ